MPYIMNGDFRLYYDVEGSGFPIVLQTGGGGNGSMWRDGGYVAGLDGYQRILLDHRGRGRSDKPATLDGYRIDRFVSDVVTLLDTLNLPRAVFWGYSGGNDTGFALAAAHPERVAALIVQGAIGSADASDPGEMASRGEYIESVRAKGMEHVVESYSTMTPWFQRQMRNTDPEVFVNSILALSDWNGPISLLPQITAPTLMLAGALEDPDGENARGAARMPNARSVTLPGLDHITAYEHSDLILAHALPFLASLSLR